MTGASRYVCGFRAVTFFALDGPVLVAALTTACGSGVSRVTPRPIDGSGAPHKEHAAPLRGLLSGTVYHYRLQGTGPDGTLFVSEDLTFRTPAAERAGQGYGRNVTNVAAGARVAEVSSVFGDSDTWAAGNASDGDPSTDWSSAGDGDAAFITVDLAAPHVLTAAGLWSRSMGSSAQIARFRVVVDGETVLGPFDLPDATQMHLFPVSISAQQL